MKIATLLCKHGAIAGLRNNAKESPLDIASEQNDVDLLELLNPSTQRLVSLHIMNQTFTGSDFSDSGMRLDSERMSNMTIVDSEAADILSLSPNRSAGNKRSTVPGPKSMKQSRSWEDDDAAGSSATAKLNNDLSALLTSKTMPSRPLHSSQNKVASHGIVHANSNPFGGLKRKNTKKVLHDMKSLSSAGKALPDLKGWMDRKSKLGAWKTYYVIVKKGFILWNGEPRNIRSGTDQYVTK